MALSLPTQAFHFGTRFLVEIDVMLPPEMVRPQFMPSAMCPNLLLTPSLFPLPQSLREAHDIGESLQNKVEALTEVERAFVHLDFETGHDPASEHKQWASMR